MSAIWLLFIDKLTIFWQRTIIQACWGLIAASSSKKAKKISWVLVLVGNLSPSQLPYLKLQITGLRILR